MQECTDDCSQESRGMAGGRVHSQWSEDNSSTLMEVGDVFLFSAKTHNYMMTENNVIMGSRQRRRKETR